MQTWKYCGILKLGKFALFFVHILKFVLFPLFWQLLDLLSSYKDVKIIQFSSMVDAFGGFADSVSCYTLKHVA